MSSKILKIVFVTLFVVLLGEIGYFLYSSRNQVSPSVMTEIKISPTQTAIKRNGKQAVDDETIEQIKNYNAGVLKKSILQNTYSGKILDIATNGNNPNNNNLHYAFMIKLVGDNDETNTFYYNDEEIEKIKVLKIDSSKTLTIADLKKEDFVVIEEVLDMTQDLDHNLVSHTISIK